MKERLKFLVSYLIYKQLGKNQKDLGKRLGYENESSFSQILNEKVAVNEGFIKKLSELAPEINSDWLLTGEGEMLRSGGYSDKSAGDLQSELVEEAEVNKSNLSDIGPLDGDFERHTTKSGNEYLVIGENNYRLKIRKVEHRAQAGYLAGWAQPSFIETLPFTIVTVKEFHKGEYRAFDVTGDSMDCNKKYAIEDGDTVIGRRIEKEFWKAKLHIRQWREWVIVHDEGIVVKHILQHDLDAGTILCHSYNEDKDLYPDYTIDLRNVYEIYNVVKVEKNR